MFPLWEPFPTEEEDVRLRSPPFCIDLSLVEASRSFKTFLEMKGVPVDAVVRRILSIIEVFKVNDWQTSELQVSASSALKPNPDIS